MSESDEHRNLVLMTARAILVRNPNFQVTTDLTSFPGNAIPPMISGYRPDVFARCQTQPTGLIIAEAKTDCDVENAHTRSQIKTFVSYLSARPHGTSTFILAVSGRVADISRRMLDFTCRDCVSYNLAIQLFDGLDFWNLGPPETPSWRLY